MCWPTWVWPTVFPYNLPGSRAGQEQGRRFFGAETQARPDRGGTAGPRPVDLPFLMLVVMLTVIGVVMVFSASYATALYDAKTGPQ